ncbi:aspartic proteinase CDR1-like [Neltuma alba]|uniref:aspartic proteinase CDR1-like n=1 Tax=Neltuma alba TaxID=207710 RepID=UPI0010A3EFAD|nr:aspartic proteinase CDR1-like [Prosopis alba]
MLPHHSLSFALLLFLSIFVFNVTAANNKLPKGFSIDLIHRDSPLSPFYNSSMTRSERFQNAALRSMSRANRFGQSSTAETSELVETDILPNDGSYLMKISVGTPPVERLALADTGSDLIWFQCSPCPKCYPQNAPLFDPKSSSTYMTLLCGSDPCKALPQVKVQGQQYPKCGTSNECTYFYSYGDKSYTIGELGTELVSFGQATSFPKTVFGCGHNNNGLYNMNNTGLVGLGQGSLSLVSQMGNVGRRFSYCLPPYSAKTTTKLRFGEEAAISGNGVVSTSLITKPGSLSSFYFLNLEGITVGQQTVRTGQSNGNIFIDSGTTLTMLPSSFYEQIEALVKQAIGANQFIVQNNHYKLCYRNANSIQNFPNFEVHFTGANLSLKPQNFFPHIANDVICFAMLPTDGMPIYGNVAQINFEVEHDLDQKKVSFAPGDCTKQ